MGVPSWNMGLVFPCYCGDALSGVRNPTKVDFQSPVQPCLVSAVSAHTSCNYSSDHPFYSLSLQGGFTLLRRAPDSSGSDSSAVISLCVWSAGRFPRSSAGFKLLLFESENVIVARGVVLIGLGWLTITDLLQLGLTCTFLVLPDPSSQDESESSLSS